MNKLRLNAILFTLLALPASAVLAGNYYIGLGAGEADYQNWNGFGGPGASYDDSDTGWKLFGGYQFSQYWGVEAAYVDLGEASVDYGSGTAAMEVDGYSLVGTATYPVSAKFGLFANAGVFIWDSKYRQTNGLSNADDDGADLTYGVGAQYQLNNQVSFRAEWTRYDDAGINFTSLGGANAKDVDLISLGVAYAF